MRHSTVRRILAATFCLGLATLPFAGLASQVPTLPSETPAKLVPTNYGFDFVRREVMIPMRDGVKLHTVILVPNGAHRAPMLLTRTPYDANALTTHANSARRRRRLPWCLREPTLSDTGPALTPPT